MGSQEAGERFGDVGGAWAECEGHPVGVVGDVGYLQGDDSGDGTGVEEQECAGDAVGQCDAVHGEEFVDPGDPLVLGERRTGACGAVSDGDGGVESGPCGEDEEGSDEVPCRRPGGEPFVDVGLGAGRGSAPIGGVEPGQEFDGLGDLLFRRVDRCLGGLPGGGFGPDAAQVVPGREVMDGLADLVGQAVELRNDPLFEPRQVRITLGKKIVVLQQRTKVFGRFAADGVESVVGAGDRPVTEPGEQSLHLGRAFPGDDRFGPVGGAQGVDETGQCGIDWGAAEQCVQVVAQDAADAQVAAVMACFDAASLAVEVDVDTGTGAADRIAVGACRAGQEPVLPAIRAGGELPEEVAMDVHTFVVVGASLAGLRAVEAARKAGFEGKIVLIGAEPHLPYDRPPLSKEFLEPHEDGAQIDAPYFRTQEVLRDELGVELVLGAPATSLDTERRVVRVGDREIGYDALVIATGSVPRVIPGTETLRGVYSLRTLDDAFGVRDALTSGAKTVIIGAGFIGSEVASGAQKRGVEVTVVEAQPTPLVRAIGPAMGEAIASLHEKNGTTLRCGVGVDRIEGDGKVERVVLADGTSIDADLVVVGVGVDPAVGWLEGTPIVIDNGIVCDENLWTGVPGVYAAGDVVNWVNPTMDERQRMENWTAAAEQGAAAAKNALDLPGAKPYGTVPYFWSDWYGSRIQFVGSANADEIAIVEGEPGTSERWVALYRRGERLIGALSLNGQAVIMKYRVKISKGVSWDEALEFAEERQAKAAAR